ncbi:hypothetical protein FZI85_27735 [Mycobacterium sp. CBMA293]|uniref:ESX-1 secretion-associated protein EspC n=1 Tax=Mycolicibacterium sp. CBMA 213 TaxID=1968788 RepID=A0A1S6GKV0_9MYCO|nr:MULTISPECIES: hypothetical protein [unclassified Mycolicibacterium]AQS22486.1 hypothetical protein pCBMA213_2_00122 [Mycolicibacterium sp. CBMA 213]MUL48386.1 hypothetical protein [Mycolicibacterium sp. CBMA 360]MUL62398.1 hypothetical protein [Mycolicibacterium sp. CBMA 335]MUM04535.1 hypothetical protein [Mycolicibacterium sp. CBMA 213]MUM14798.1 hypothetical protein [Mycolicibacterium sp. CBMA 293]
MSTDDQHSNDQFELDHYAEISALRDKLTGELAQILSTGMAAATTLRDLQSNSVYDVELCECTAGDDVQKFIDDAMRFTRAAYTVLHDLTERDK